MNIIVLHQSNRDTPMDLQLSVCHEWRLPGGLSDALNFRWPQAVIKSL